MTFCCHTSADELADGFEGHHTLHGGTDRLYVIEQHEQQSKGADETHEAEHLLDGYHEHLHIVEVDASAEGVGYLVAQPVAIESSADALAYAVTDEAADGEGHEERGELDEVFQIDGHRGEEDAVAKGAQERGQPQPLDIQCG